MWTWEWIFHSSRSICWGPSLHEVEAGVIIYILLLVCFGLWHQWQYHYFVTITLMMITAYLCWIFTCYEKYRSQSNILKCLHQKSLSLGAKQNKLHAGSPAILSIPMMITWNHTCKTLCSKRLYKPKLLLSDVLS